MRSRRKKRRTRVKPALALVAPRQYRCQVKAKAVHTQRSGPVAQAVQHQLQHARLVQVQAIAAAAPVLVQVRAVFAQLVVQRVVNAAQAQRWPQFVAFGAVVVDHVDHHLHAARMHRIDQGAELAGRAGAGPAAPVTRLGRKPGNAVVTPVVAQAHAQQSRLVGTLLHRHQAQRGHAQGLQMVQHHRFSQPGIAAAQGLGHLRVQRGHGLDVQLVQHACTSGNAWRWHSAHRQRRRHPGFQRRCRVVAGIGQHGIPCIVTVVNGFAVVPPQNFTRIRVEQQLGRVEALAARRIPRSVHAVAVHQADLAPPPARQMTMPNASAASGQRKAMQGLAVRVKKAQLHRARLQRHQCKVDAIGIRR